MGEYANILESIETTHTSQQLPHLNIGSACHVRRGFGPVKSTTGPLLTLFTKGLLDGRLGPDYQV